MNKIDELLSLSCSDGVPCYKLGDVVTFLNGRAYKQEELLSQGKYRVLRVGNFYTNDSWYYSDLELDEDKYCNNGDLLYTWAASLGPQIWNGEKAIFHYHIWKLVFDEKLVMKEYLYHYLAMDVQQIYSSLTHSTMPHVSMANMKERTIFIPPMNVQIEVVKRLNKFVDLRAELVSELGLRKQQYEYYLNSLITSYVDAPMVKLRDICRFYNGDRGKNYPKVSEMVSEGIPFVNAGDVNGTVDYEGCNKITREKYNSMSGAKLQKGDILYCLRGSTGKNGLYELDEGTVASSLVAIRANEKVHYKFLFYLLNSRMEKQQRLRNDTGAAQPNLSAQSVGGYEFPLPPLEYQLQIVEKLDSFYNICNSTASGIPAEIEARTKQYEYYRDKLLSFKEA